MKDAFIDHLRLNPGQRHQLLGRLDRSPEPETAKCKRQHARLEYRALDIAVSVTHPGGSRSRLLVCSRNLSAGGIAFLHGGFLHPGTECSMVLIRRDGTPLAVMGNVRHCRHLQGSVYEIGIQFNREIDPTAVIIPSDLDDKVIAHGLHPSVKIPNLRGRLLIVDDSAADRRLFSHQMQATGLEIVAVDTSGAALDAIRKQRFTAVVCGLDLADGSGIYAVRRMRECGYNGPILILTAEISARLLAEVRAAGANELLGKPYEPGYVMYLLSEWLDQPARPDAIVSRFDCEPGMSGMLMGYIGETRRLATRLSAAINEEDAALVRELCVKIAGSGSHHGFDQLSVAARDALWNLDTAEQVSDALGPLRRLVCLCDRLRCNTQD
jgi:CheY-like chemotaxis protein